MGSTASLFIQHKFAGIEAPYPLRTKGFFGLKTPITRPKSNKSKQKYSSSKGHKYPDKERVGRTVLIHIQWNRTAKDLAMKKTELKDI